MYAIEPSRIGRADKVAAAVNCSAENDAVCNLNPLGVVKSRRSRNRTVRISQKQGKQLFEVAVRFEYKLSSFQSVVLLKE